MKRTTTTKTSRAQFSRVCLALAMLTALPLAVKAQSGPGAVKLAAQVSGTVALSVAPDAQVGSDNVQVTSHNLNLRTVAISLSGGQSGVTEIRVPVQIRSNVGYALAVSLNSNGTVGSGLRVVGARPTGQFVTAEAVNGLNIAERFDGRSGTGTLQIALQNLTAMDAFSQLPLLTGPRISRAGLLSSPNNAVEIMLVIAVSSPAGGGQWAVEMVISA